MTGTDGQFINLDGETAKVPKYSKPNITILNKESSKPVLFKTKALRLEFQSVARALFLGKTRIPARVFCESHQLAENKPLFQRKKTGH